MLNFALFALGVIFADRSMVNASCTSGQYTLTKPAGRYIMTDMVADFNISEASLNRTNCNEAVTVCVSTKKTLTTIAFSGRFPTPSKPMVSVTVLGGDKSSQIPVVYLKDKQSFANPPVGDFGSAGKVTFGGSLKFTVAIFDATIRPTGKLMEFTEKRDCPADNLCYDVSAKNVRLWGEMGAFRSVTVTGRGGASVVIPFIRRAKYEKNTNPRLLALPENGVIASSVDIEIPFAPTNVLAQGGTLKEKTLCNENDACYEIIPPKTIAIFEGVMPATPLTITLNDTSSEKSISFDFVASGARKVFAMTLISAGAAISIPQL